MPPSFHAPTLRRMSLSFHVPAPRRLRRSSVTPGRLPLSLLALTLAGCASGVLATPTGPLVPGTDASPREINIIAYDYSYSPSVLDLVPGETVLIHVIDAGLVTHEVVIGDAATQDAWEQAEAAATPAPPGETPDVGVAPGVTGLRVVVTSGERRDVLFHVPDGSSPLVVGCHIPGHWARGMQIPIRFVSPTPAATR